MYEVVLLYIQMMDLSTVTAKRLFPDIKWYFVSFESICGEVSNSRSFISCPYIWLSLDLLFGDTVGF